MPGKKNKPVDYKLLQRVIDEKSINYNGGQTEFLDTVQASYNLQSKCKISSSLIYARWKSNKVKIEIPFRRNILSEEHKKKLQAGRESHKNASQKRKFQNTPYGDRLRERYADKPKAVQKVLYHNSMANAINLFCWSCCCGDREAIRDCSAYACPLFPFRPYKPESGA